MKKRAQKFKIGVQPEAVKRGRGKHGSKGAQAKGKSSDFIPVKTMTMKRKQKPPDNVSKG